MKKNMKSIVGKLMLLSLSLVLALALSSTVSMAASKKPKKIYITPTKKTITVGETVKIKVKKVKPSKASKAVTYKSSNKAIATVSSKGVVKGIKAGKVTITVTSKKNKKVKAKATINVKAAPVKAPEKKSLVVYFTRGENCENAQELYDEYVADNKTIDAIASASVMKRDNGELTGSIGLVSDWIAEAVGGKTFSIHTVNKYPQTKKATQSVVVNDEQVNGVLPEIEPFTENLDEYDVIYLGVLNWYGEPPHAIYTFINENKEKLAGKIIVPFCVYENQRNKFSDCVDIIKSKLPDSAVLGEEDSLLVYIRTWDEGHKTPKETTLNWVEAVQSKINTAKVNPLATLAGQKDAAKALIGQELYEQDIIDAVGQYSKVSPDTNGCTHEVTSIRFYYPGFVIYARAVETLEYATDYKPTTKIKVYSID